MKRDSIPTTATRVAASLVGAILISVLGACGGNPFAPQKHVPTDIVDRPPAQEATSPEIVMDNLARAFNEREKELYETLLDERFWFTEDNCLGEVLWQNDREEELEIMGPRDGSSQGIFDIFRTIEWEFQFIERETELGRNFPSAFEGDPDGHPDEDWEVFRGRVEMLLLEARDEGFRVNQIMTFKLRQGEDGLWRIVRWIDDPLAGDCGDIPSDEGSAKAGSAPVEVSWSALKQRPN